MNLIDAYVSEVGRNLPAKTREDIEKETRSLIEDMLDDEAQKQGRQPDEAMIVDVLKRMGPPAKVAASYQPPRYLIGPKYYPFFWMVVRIVLSVLLVVGAIGMGIQLGQENLAGPEFLSKLGLGFADLISSLIAAFGNIVLVFVILQWLMPEPKFDEKEEWDPSELEVKPDPEQVKTFDMVAGIVFNVILLLLLNVYPQWMSISTYVNGEWEHVRLLTDAFFRFVPWISLQLAVQIGLYSYLLREEKWNTPARVIQIGISLLSIVILGLMISGPALAAINQADLARLGWTDVIAPAGTVNNMVNLALRIALGITIVTQVIDIGKMILRIAGKHIALPADLTR